MRKDSKYNVFCCKLILKIFINDLPYNIQNTDDDVDLTDNFIYCLMYADDVVLLSKSRMGLQQNLIVLANSVRTGASQSMCQKQTLNFK